MILAIGLCARRRRLHRGGDCKGAAYLFRGPPPQGGSICCGNHQTGTLNLYASVRGGSGLCGAAGLGRAGVGTWVERLLQALLLSLGGGPRAFAGEPAPGICAGVWNQGAWSGLKARRLQRMREN